jgi:hypothetical protein
MGAVNGKKSKKSTHIARQTDSTSKHFVVDSNIHFQNIVNIKTIIFTLHALKKKFENTIPKEILSQILLDMIIRPPQSLPSSRSFSSHVNEVIKIVLLGDGAGIISIHY